jgi:hypothetical protein
LQAKSVEFEQDGADWEPASAARLLYKTHHLRVGKTHHLRNTDAVRKKNFLDFTLLGLI